ncbi:hypothetical protein PVAND_012895 [Polypedilum vanderplanki]|uniref:Uncharacterized protein n=1 Tax=Polypedilum vanderplanki TaxID=319348 RepID=A0A9J6CPV1_POLVA|nr:hypothetical protein PVAND_012895 [Polypedilum vanderplanki]
MMDRVLSYQTAVRAGSHDTSGFDIRQYISKRTCISMTMSIAFIALIFGFLLGKFTSDRNHIIKEKRPTIHKPLVMENEIEKVINTVVRAARIREMTNYKEQHSKEEEENDDDAKSFLSFYRTNFTNCLSDVTNDNLDDTLEDFLHNLLTEHYKIYLKCARELENILNIND